MVVVKSDLLEEIIGIGVSETDVIHYSFIGGQFIDARSLMAKKNLVPVSFADELKRRIFFLEKGMRDTHFSYVFCGNDSFVIFPEDPDLVTVCLNSDSYLLKSNMGGGFTNNLKDIITSSGFNTFFQTFSRTEVEGNYSPDEILKSNFFRFISRSKGFVPDIIALDENVLERYVGFMLDEDPLFSMSVYFQGLVYNPNTFGKTFIPNQILHNPIIFSTRSLRDSIYLQPEALSLEDGVSIGYSK